MINFKQIFIYALLLCMGLNSCCQNDIELQQSSIKVEVQDCNYYNLINDKRYDTRSSSLSSNTLSSLGIFAYYHNSDESFNNSSKPNLMFNQYVSRSNSISPWEYSPVQYWPNTGCVSFFAYAPYLSSDNSNIIISSDNDDSAYPSFKFIMPDSVSVLTDFLVAVPQNEKTKDTLDKLLFKHKLSLIKFYAKSSSALLEGNFIRIKSIKIGSFIKSAVFAYPEWKNKSAEKIDYLLSYEDNSLNDVKLSTNNQLISNSQTDLMVIPQNIDDSSFLEITIEYRNNSQVIIQTFKKSINEYFHFWEMAKAHNIYLSVNPITDVNIDVQVSDWNTYNINIPSLN